MASTFDQESMRSDAEQQANTEPNAPLASSPSPDTAPGSTPVQEPPTEPGVPAAAPEPPHYMPGPTASSAAPEAPASAPPYAPPYTPTPATTPPGEVAAPPTLSRQQRPWWRGPLGVLAALAVVALLILGGWAIGHATASTATVGGVAPTVAVPPAAQDLQQTLITVIHEVQPSVVEVNSTGSQGGAIGSGEILTASGYIVTNDHVVAGFSSFTVILATGQTIPAQLVGAAPQEDLAVLKIQGTNLRPITIGDSRAVQVGEFAIAMGSPLGLQQSATQGIVSALDRQASEGQNGPFLTGLIQTSAPINPGNSGGALVDLQGHLIGIPTLAAANPESGAAAAGIGFAIASDRVKFVTNQLIQHGHLVSTGQGFLGIQGVDVTPQLASAYNLPVQSGVAIVGFTNDAAGQSPAQQAGLLRGDIITAVNGKPIANQADLVATLLTKEPGTKVTITVQRGSSQQNVKVTLGERPANP